MSRQGLYVEKESGNIIQVKFRRDFSYRYPHMNRLDIHNKKADYLTSVYTNTDREIEAISEMSNGDYIFAYHADDGKRVALFTRASIKKSKGLFSTYPKNYLNLSDYSSSSNNIYYKEDKESLSLVETGTRV